MLAHAPHAPLAALVLLLALSHVATGCARLPALAIAARLRVATEERAAAQSMALIVGCGWKLERDSVARARAGEPPPGATPGVQIESVGCAEPTLCAWQRAAELGAAQVLLPMAEEQP